jgi:hypothetical protein
MSRELTQLYPIQNILKYEFYLDIWGVLHYMYENNIIITGSVITYSIHQWEHFDSDLDLWVPPCDYDKKYSLHLLLNSNGYLLSNTDYSNSNDNTEFSKNFEMVSHYYKCYSHGFYKKIDVVYTKIDPEEILKNSDITLNMNFAKVINVNNRLNIEINSLNETAKMDLINRKLNLNPTQIENIFLNQYEATKKKQRFDKYNHRGFEADPVMKDTYYELLDKFISGDNVKSENNLGLSQETIELIRELSSYANRQINI